MLFIEFLSKIDGHDKVPVQGVLADALYLVVMNLRRLGYQVYGKPSDIRFCHQTKQFEGQIVAVSKDDEMTIEATLC